MGSCYCKKGTQVIHPQRTSNSSVDSDNESEKETNEKFDQIGISNSDQSKLIEGYQHEPLVSLEAALKPFDSQIHRLSMQIKQAKQQCHYPSAQHHLSHDESAAIHLYSIQNNPNSVYNHLHRAWKSNNRSQMQPWFKYLRLFRSGLDKLPNTKTEIWQGISYDSQWSKTLQSNLSPFYTCMSTGSLSVTHIKESLNRQSTSKMILVGYESINGRDITGYTANHEKEVIIWPGIKLKKIGNEEIDQHGSWTIHFTGQFSSGRSNQSSTKTMTSDQKHFICPLSACGNRCRVDHETHHCNGFSFLFRHVSHHCGTRQSCFHCNKQLENLFECHICRGRFCEKCSFK